MEGARGGVLGQGFCVLRGSFARCFAEVAALFALSGKAGAVDMRGEKRFFVESVEFFGEINFLQIYFVLSRNQLSIGPYRAFLELDRSCFHPSSR